MLRRSITGESQPAVVKYGMCANADDADADEEFEEEEEEDGDDRADVPFGGLHIEAHAHRYAPLTSLNYYLLLTGLAGDTVPMPAIAEVDQNLTATVTDTIATLIPCEDEQHAEILILQSAGGSNTEHAWVECPKKVGNLQAAMSLMDDSCTYHDFCVYIARLALATDLDTEIHWSRQDVNKIAHMCAMARKKYNFLKCYIRDWPIKEYLKRHFANQRNYKRRTQHIKDAAAAQGKNKGKGVEDSDDMWDFGSNADENGDD
ncbi:hypothetical protein V8E52_007781, partial [Russula decolorans]